MRQINEMTRERVAAAVSLCRRKQGNGILHSSSTPPQVTFNLHTRGCAPLREYQMGCLCSSSGRCGPSKCTSSPTKEQKWSTNYIALAILNANRAASLVVHDICTGELEHQCIADMIIRRAKNDGRTVSVINGCLYLDYKFAGVLPIPLPTSTSTRESRESAQIPAEV